VLPGVGGYAVMSAARADDDEAGGLEK
jgi:hypothetical protein